MEQEFVPYELAVKLKALGFNEPCFGYYIETGEWIPASYSREGIIYPSNKDLLPEWVTSATFSQAFRWFDYSTEWSGFIVPSKEEGCFEWWIQNYTDPQLSMESEDWYRGREEAERACLDKLIETVETKSE